MYFFYKTNKHQLKFTHTSARYRIRIQIKVSSLIISKLSIE